MRGSPLPPNLIGIDALLYYALCYVCRIYKEGEIGRSDGTKIKKRIVSEYERATNTQSKYDGMWKRIEQAAHDYTTNSTIENADKFHAAVYNLPEDWRFTR